jgi:hypothetical protein
MNLSRFLKGTITIGELENMPNRYIHTFYKQYTDMLKDEEAQKAKAAEDMVEEMADAGLGG